MFKARLSLLCAALWWGSLTTTGFIVVPLLFAYLGTPAQAGAMAARLFTAQSWVSLACGLLMLMAARERDPAGLAAWARPLLPWLLGGLLLALLGEYAVAPRIVARENLRLWHSLGSGLYLLQWACAGWSLWSLGRSAAAPGAAA